MYRKFLFLIAAFFIALALILIVSGSPTHQLIAQMMGRRNMGSDMRIIHQLFADRDLVHRTVEQIPNGIRAVTESDDPEIAARIQTHVAKMYRHLDEKSAFPGIGMAPTLPELFRNVDRYQRQMQMTPKGVIVSETSSDADMVLLIREHAREVDRFISEGMPIMMHGMNDRMRQ
ncbi:hypothetical protein TUMEXPCC7403_00565 [Tumidithrix helvetica PCC 7403]|uniref:hypothetical protein n=1 Tax=Tumidithrix helvetica TaxID=3457545 RepID=UPI003CB30632